MSTILGCLLHVGSEKKKTLLRRPHAAALCTPMLLEEPLANENRPQIADRRDPNSPKLVLFVGFRAQSINI